MPKFLTNLVLSAAAMAAGIANGAEQPLNGANIPGATLAPYTAPAGADGTNAAGLVITRQPADRYAVAGGNAIFFGRGRSLGSNPVAYQWAFNGVDLAGATNAALRLTNVQAEQQGSYHFVISSGGVRRASSNANLYLVEPPAITSQSTPTNIICLYGSRVSLAATASARMETNGPPLLCQWQLNGTNLGIGNPTNYSFFADDEAAGVYSLVASNLAGSVSASWRVTVTHAINVTNDLLLIYNTNSPDSTTVLNYYLGHRPNVRGANVLGIGYVNTNAPDYFETITPDDFTNQIVAPLRAWLAANPAKRPQYVVLFMDLPSRVNNYAGAKIFYPYPTGIHPSVSVQLRAIVAGWQPFVTHLNMGMTSPADRTSDSIGYINKLAAIGVPISEHSPVLSARAGGYGNTNYLLDNVRFGMACAHCENFSGAGGFIASVTNRLLAAGAAASAITYRDGLILTGDNSAYSAHIREGSNVAGYMSWGVHGELAGETTFDGTLRWRGHSGWWLVETIESHNGQQHGDQGRFTFWFSPDAFGGSKYSNTPVGAVAYTDEPFLGGQNDAAIYFGLWEAGKPFGICAWQSRHTSNFEAVGDPLVIR